MSAFRLYTGVVGFVFAAMSLSPNCLLAGDPWSLGEIEAPLDAGTVGIREVVVVKTTSQFKPMVAVRSLAEGSLWWVLDEGVFRGPNRYEVGVRFGNEQTPTGTCFQVTVLDAKDAASAKKVRAGDSWENLPPGISYSHVITVFTGNNPKATPPIMDSVPATFPATLVSPKPGSTAKRAQSVSWALDVPANDRPSLLVRVAEENSPWWVQSSLRRSTDKKRFSGIARIGNLHTAPGTQFLLMLVRPKSSAAGAALQTGSVLTDTSDYHCSPEFTLTAK
ncbi:hypothetical protein [Planctomycetes bacterium K23_9]|uniref:Uncharacterized protein n=1 Tax=Stieleria marina TaxID=1930275 RepID=A0A517NXJ8_9BACT|nr:hypothetical protein K239x_38590 [Planctomycetes bacterium K23_9]